MTSSIAQYLYSHKNNLTIACLNMLLIYTNDKYDYVSALILTSAMLLLCTDCNHKLQAMLISCSDLYMFFGCYLPIQLVLKSLSSALTRVLSRVCDVRSILLCTDSSHGLQEVSFYV